MSNIISKLNFLIKKPKVIIVAGEGRACAAEAICKILEKFKKEFLLFELDTEKIEEFEFFIKRSSLPILVVTHTGDIPPNKDFFAGEIEKNTEIRKLARIMPSHGYLVLNFDDETVREIKDYNPPIAHSHIFTFGFQEGANFRATDIRLNTGTNFKINYKGDIVPVWLERLFGKEQIFTALTVAAVGVIFDLNLIEASQALKDYHSLPGKMRLTKGVKNSWILDDSKSATIFSMIEAIEILGKISLPPNFGGESSPRKIAVLGDVIGIGKYTIEAHEAIGEKVVGNTDLLFTFGHRAKFIAQGAQSRGMSLDKIFQFDNIEGGKIQLQNEIKEGDLILVDGSKEMEMGKIVEEIKAGR